MRYKMHDIMLTTLTCNWLSLLMRTHTDTTVLRPFFGDDPVAWFAEQKQSKIEEKELEDKQRVKET